MADGSAITQIRTGAVSGVATDLLARRDAYRLAIIGAGVQARSHLEAMLLVREIREVLCLRYFSGKCTALPAGNAGKIWRCNTGL